MKKLNPREKFILIVTLVLVAIFIIYRMVVIPMRQGSMDIDARLRLDRQELMKDRQLKAQKANIEARYQNLVNLIGVADSEENQVPTIVSKIEAAARESNVHIANIQPQKPAIQKEVRFLPVELEIDGRWLDIVQFIYFLQERPNFYFIDEFNIEKYSDTINSLRGRIVVSHLCLVNP